MKREILRCPNCETYTLAPNCHQCKTKTITPKPAKFNIDDKFGKWRRKYKKNVRN